MSHCQLILDENSSCVTAGGPVKGKVICTFRSPKTIRGIKLRLKGTEHTEWTGTESYYNESEKKHQTRSIRLHGDNEVFSFDTLLFGSNSGERTINQGIHTYPFHVVLPKNIPSTFEGTHGHICYKIIAIVDVPMSLDYEHSLPLDVLSPIDFRTTYRSFLKPGAYNREKTMGLCCCASGPLTIEANIKKRAFTPGENIELTVDVSNLSNVNVEGLKIRLRQNIRSTVRHPHHESKYDSIKIGQNRMTGVGAHGERTYDISLPIPNNLRVPNFLNSALFHVDYVLKITFELPGVHINPDISIDCFLGHATPSNETMSPPPVMTQPSAPGFITNSAPGAPQPAYNPYPPTFPTLPEGALVPDLTGLPPYASTGPSAPVEASFHDLSAPSYANAPPSYDEAQKFYEKK